MKILPIYEALLRESLLNEVSDDIYNIISEKYPNGRIIMNNNIDAENSSEINYTPTQQENETKMKPNGLWYAIGSEWIDWVRGEMPHWEGENAFVVDIDESKILKIDTFEKLLAFDKEYGLKVMKGLKLTGINWSEVAKRYGGIEIAPYIYKGRFEINWYYGWDVASGCIWGDGVIKSITRIE